MARVLGVALMAAVAVAVATASPATFYVCSTTGKDSNPGTPAAPFATLSRARDAVRGLRDQDTGALPAGGAQVLIKAGDYANSPADSAAPVLELDPAQDSGDSASSPVAWAAECGGAGGDCWLHGFWKYDWADSYVRLASVAAAPGGGSLIQTDASTPPVYGFEPKARFYGVSLLSELDVPGEYFVDRQSLRAFILPPHGAAPSDEVAIGVASAIVTTAASAAGARSHAAEARARVAATRNFVADPFQAARGRWEELGEAAVARRAAAEAASAAPLSFVTFRGLQLRYAFRGISVAGARSVTVEGVDAAGMTHVGLSIDGFDNEVDGANVSLAGCSAAHVGGGVEATLQPGGNKASGVVAVGYARLTRTYTPGISWGGVGNAYSASSVGHAPHNGWLGGGNNNLFLGNEASLLCFEVSDSGAWYSGRSWARRNNTLRDCTIANVITMEEPALGASSIQAVYNDDQLSANSFLDNDFVNVHAAMFIGGGRRHTVTGNAFRGAGLAVHIDDRGLTWQKTDCNPVNGSLVAALNALHYRQPPWSTSYPQLVNITQDHPCVPVYNLIANNCFQNVTQFTDVSPEHQAQWLESYANNTSPCW